MIDNETIEYKVGSLLKRFNFIEKQISEILKRYIAPKTPEKTEFLLKNVFHNSIVNSASKMKLFFDLNKSNKWVMIEDEDLKRLLRLRNAITHGDTGSRNVTVDLGIPSEDQNHVRIYYHIESIKGNGQLETLESDKVFEELSNLLDDLEIKTKEVLEKI